MAEKDSKYLQNIRREYVETKHSIKTALPKKEKNNRSEILKRLEDTVLYREKKKELENDYEFYRTHKDLPPSNKISAIYIFLKESYPAGDFSVLFPALKNFMNYKQNKETPFSSNLSYTSAYPGLNDMFTETAESLQIYTNDTRLAARDFKVFLRHFPNPGEPGYADASAVASALMKDEIFRDTLLEALTGAYIITCTDRFLARSFTKAKIERPLINNYSAWNPDNLKKAERPLLDVCNDVYNSFMQKIMQEEKRLRTDAMLADAEDSYLLARKKYLNVYLPLRSDSSTGVSVAFFGAQYVSDIVADLRKYDREHVSKNHIIPGKDDFDEDDFTDDSDFVFRVQCAFAPKQDRFLTKRAAPDSKNADGIAASLDEKIYKLLPDDPEEAVREYRARIRYEQERIARTNRELMAEPGISGYFDPYSSTAGQSAASGKTVSAEEKRRIREEASAELARERKQPL